jgi:hypothetical protein
MGPIRSRTRWRSSRRDTPCRHRADRSWGSFASPGRVAYPLAWGCFLTFPANTPIAAAMALRRQPTEGSGYGDVAAELPSVGEDGPQVLGEVTTLNGYQGLVRLFQARLEQIGDRAGRLTADHFKRFCPVTLGAQLAVLGVKLIFVEDAEQMRIMRDRWTPATFKRWRTYASSAIPARRRPRKSYFIFARSPEFARAERMRQLERMTPKQRTRMARRAARARWGRRSEGSTQTATLT